MSVLLHSISLPLVAFLLQSMVVSAIALIAGHFGAKRGPGFRVAVYRSGLLSILVLLVAGPAMRLVAKPWWEISGSRHNAVARATGTLSQSDLESATAKQLSQKKPNSAPTDPGLSTGSNLTVHSIQSGITSTASDAGDSFFGTLAAILVAGTILILGAIVAGSAWVGGLRNTKTTDACMRLKEILRSVCIRQGFDQPALCISPYVGSAFVTGISKPVIYLPENIEDQFDSDQIEAMLCHELVHVRQGDCLWALISRLCCAVSWANPLTWVLSRRLTLAGEEYCDQLVLGSGIEPATYAGCLLRVAETINSRSAERLVGAGVFPAKSQLSKRISLMLNNKSYSSTAVTKPARLKIAAIAFLAALGACLIVSASPFATRRDSTPEDTVKGFFDSFNKHDWKAMFSHVEGARVEEASAGLQEAMKHGPVPKLNVHLSNTELKGDAAKIHVKIEFDESSVPKPTPEASEEDVNLHQTNGDWKIVSGNSKNGIIKELVEMARDPKLMGKARSAAQKTIIVSNFKQIALGIIMFIGDHDDKYALTQASLKSVIKPYTKNDSLWLGPDGKPMDIRFNPALVGKSESQVPNPSTCVLFSWGPKGNLQFTDNVTPIAFVDGHVKYVNRLGLDQLSWK